MRRISIVICFPAVLACIACLSSFVKIPEPLKSTDTGIVAKIELNREETDHCGLPVATYGDYTFFACMLDGDVAEFISGKQHFELTRNDTIISFNYRDSLIQVNGQFLIPTWDEIEYQKGYNLETITVGTLRPYKVKNLVR